MSGDNPAVPKFGLLYGILLPVLVVPVVVIMWLLVRGNEAEQYYQRALAEANAGNYPAAMTDFKEAGKRGHSDAYCNLGLMHLYGIGGEPAIQTARDYLELAALGGSMRAEYELGSLAENDPAGADYDQAALHYNRAALAGHVPAMIAIGRFYESGRGVHPSPILAAEFYRKAAAAGSAEAQYALGELYVSEALGTPDLERAFEYFSLAAAQGFPGGYGGLGYIYEHGWGDNRPDLAQARKFYRRAAELGDPAAMVNLGDLLARDGNDAEALQLYQNAANSDYAPAWHRLGLRHFSGSGEEAPDYAAARLCFLRAARRGNAASWINLGIMYELGRGGAPDDYHAEECYLQAKQMGHPEADKRLEALRTARAQHSATSQQP